MNAGLGSLVIAVGSGFDHLVLLFLGLELNTTEAYMLFPGKKGQERKGYPGGQVLIFPSFAPCKVFCLGDHLHLAVNCLAMGYSCLFQFPYSIRQGIFLASHYPVSTLGAETEPCTLHAFRMGKTFYGDLWLVPWSPTPFQERQE